MNDMQAFRQRTNEARAAIGKPPVMHAPFVPFSLRRDSTIGTLIMVARRHELDRSIALAEIERIANEARQ